MNAFTNVGSAELVIAKIQYVSFATGIENRKGRENTIKGDGVEVFLPEDMQGVVEWA